MIKYKIKSESSWICFRNPTEIYVVGSQGKGILETLSRINSKRQRKTVKLDRPDIVNYQTKKVLDINAYHNYMPVISSNLKKQKVSPSSSSNRTPEKNRKSLWMKTVVLVSTRDPASYGVVKYKDQG